MTIQFLLDLISQKNKDKVHTASQKPFEEVFNVGIALKWNGGISFHAGLLYKDNSGQCLLLHVPGDMSLQSNPPESEYIWVSPDIHPVRALMIAGVCRLVWDTNRGTGIPYGFSDPRDCFDRLSREFLKEGRVGLTCSSLVLAVFDFGGIRLVDYDSWKPRTIDEQIFKHYADHIEQEKKKFGVDDKFITRLRSELKNFRYSPIDVAGAGMAITQSNRQGVSYEEAVLHSSYIDYFAKTQNSMAA